jgi:integrase
VAARRPGEPGALRGVSRKEQSVMSKAWVYQDPKQVKKHGADVASWYVGWIDPDGKRRCESCGPGKTGLGLAEKVRKKREAELITGTYQSKARKTWAEFREEYEEKIVNGLEGSTARQIVTAFEHFERLIKPVRMTGIKTQSIDTYRSKRRTEHGKNPGSVVSPATINKELRHVRAALRKAKKWGYVAAAPDFDFEREPKKLVTYITPEHFAKIYEACSKAELPEGFPFSPADWWRGLLVMGYMTGWRIGELLALRREDLDLEYGEAITRHGDNKGKRDERVALHPLVVEHLRKLTCFDVRVFPWNESETALYQEFGRIQRLARIHLPCSGEHEHTPACHVYGFHDGRRAFATMNADRLSAEALQHLMRHKSYLTTQKYINMARQMKPAVQDLYVPTLPKIGHGG